MPRYWYRMYCNSGEVNFLYILVCWFWYYWLDSRLGHDLHFTDAGKLCLVRPNPRVVWEPIYYRVSHKLCNVIGSQRKFQIIIYHMANTQPRIKWTCFLFDSHIQNFCYFNMQGQQNLISESSDMGCIKWARGPQVSYSWSNQWRWHE